MTKKYAELSEQDWWAASDTILMLGNVDIFYCPDLVYPYDLYQYVANKVWRRLAYIKSCLTEPAAVTPVLDQMIKLCDDFHAELSKAQRNKLRSKKTDLSEHEATKLAKVFLDKMSEPITKLVKDYDLYPSNRCLTELMVRDNSATTPVTML